MPKTLTIEEVISSEVNVNDVKKKTVTIKIKNPWKEISVPKDVIQEMGKILKEQINHFRKRYAEEFPDNKKKIPIDISFNYNIVEFLGETTIFIVFSYLEKYSVEEDLMITIEIYKHRIEDYFLSIPDATKELSETLAKRLDALEINLSKTTLNLASLHQSYITSMVEFANEFNEFIGYLTLDKKDNVHWLHGKDTWDNRKVSLQRKLMNIATDIRRGIGRVEFAQNPYNQMSKDLNKKWEEYTNYVSCISGKMWPR